MSNDVSILLGLYRESVLMNTLNISSSKITKNIVLNEQIYTLIEFINDRNKFVSWELWFKNECLSEEQVLELYASVNLTRQLKNSKC